MNSVLVLAATYAIGIAGGAMFAFLKVPLAWMVGSAIAVVLAATAGFRPYSPRLTRSLGQIVVAAAIGAQMSGGALEQLLLYLPSMIAAAGFTIIAGLAVSAVFARVAHVSAIKACLACIPLGPMEAARLAERYDIDPGSVALAQALRIITLVLIIPPGLIWIFGAGDMSTLSMQSQYDLASSLMLLGGALAVGLTGAALRIPNGAFLGALIFGAVGSLLGWPIGTMPGILLIGGQILLGVSLGIMFDPATVSRLFGFSVASIAATIALLLLCLLTAATITATSDIAIETAILATSPGSLAEMSLTAKLLHQEVSLVTAFHIVRISFVLLMAPLAFRFVYWLSMRL